MKWGKALLVGAACAALTATSAHAADLTPIITTPTVTAPAAPPTFAWAGPYAGVTGSVLYCSFCGPPFGGAAGVSAGYNLVSGSTLFGASADIFVAFGGGVAVGLEANGRVGVLIGSRALLYGEGGVGWFVGSTLPHLTLGGGVEVAINNTMSIYGEVKPYWYFGGGGGLFGPFWRATAGVNFHFGG